MPDIKLNYIDLSNDPNNSEIVIFQKNIATGFDANAVAWKVIRNCGKGNNHPFTFPLEFTVGAADSWGNYTPQLSATSGELYGVVLRPSVHELVYSGPATSTKEVQIENQLQAGAISAHIYKDGRLLATQTGIAPSQKAVFQFKPTIFIGCGTQITEGQVMNSEVVSSVHTELSLLGIASADIVMTGGADQNTDPFTFTLENVVLA